MTFAGAPTKPGDQELTPTVRLLVNQITGNIALMTIGCMIAISTTREALRLYEKRSGTEIPL